MMVAAGYEKNYAITFPANLRSLLDKEALCDDVGLSMMCYTQGKSERACFGERQLSGLMGK